MSSGCVAAADAVDVSFNGCPVFRDVSLCLRRGTLLVVGGASGSGKSTLLRVLWGAVRPARGTVSGGGIDLTNGSANRLAAWRRQIGIYSADFPLADNWTAFDNLLAALNTQSPQVSLIAADRVTRTLGRWGLLPKRHERTAHLTDRERARLALARAVVRSPVAAFIDDPLAAIPDGEHDAIIAEIRLAAKLGTAVLVTTTNWERWSSAADELMLIEDGCLRSFPGALPAGRGVSG